MGAGHGHEEPKEEYVRIAMFNAGQSKPFVSRRKLDIGGTSLGGRFCFNTWPYEALTFYPFGIKRELSLDDKKITVELFYNFSFDRTQDIVVRLFSRHHPTGIAFLYSIADVTSWEELKVVIESALDGANSFAGNNSRRFMIVGCKCDLVQEREVDYVTVKQYADEKGFLFFETSARENINVEPAFVSFVAQLLSQFVQT